MSQALHSLIETMKATPLNDWHTYNLALSDPAELQRRASDEAPTVTDGASLMSEWAGYLE
jgi:hypothetical protein